MRYSFQQYRCIRFQTKSNHFMKKKSRYFSDEIPLPCLKLNKTGQGRGFGKLFFDFDKTGYAQCFRNK